MNELSCMARLDELLDRLRRDEPVHLRLAPQLWLSLGGQYGQLRLGNEDAGNDYPENGVDIFFFQNEQGIEGIEVKQLALLMDEKYGPAMLNRIDERGKGASQVTRPEDVMPTVFYDNLCESATGWYATSLLAAGTRDLLDSMTKLKPPEDEIQVQTKLAGVYDNIATIAGKAAEELEVRIEGLQEEAMKEGVKLFLSSYVELIAAVDQRLGYD